MSNITIIEPCPETRSTWRKDQDQAQCYITDNEHVTVYYNGEVFQHDTIEGARVFTVKAQDSDDSYAAGPTTSVQWSFSREVSTHELPPTGVDPMVGIGGGILGVMLIIGGAIALITRKRKA
ncbi:hypothetical protein SEA_ATRAXI_19 [Microbacterium phage Atraxi]|nr:hypothetical protein SEA_ATRAXI_19 [Microbacterium phage Atraxi]